MKAIDIENLLKDTYVGKPYHPTHSTVSHTVADYLEANGYDRSKMCFERSRNSPSTLYVEVKAPYEAGGNVAFITIVTKKSKAATHHSWGGSYCDWEYADFKVSSIGEETIEDACMKAASIVKTRLANNRAKEDKVREIFEFLKSKGYDKWTAIDLVSKAKSIAYTMTDEVYNEKTS